MGENTHMLFYLLHSRVHWPQRRSIALEALDIVRSRQKVTRVVDLGCGPTLFGRDVISKNLNYIAIDRDIPSMEWSNSHIRNSDAMHIVADITQLPLGIGAEDVVICNGVIHHLSDHMLQAMLSQMSECGALIILDHDKVLHPTTLLKFIQQQMQRCDRGKFVRQARQIAEIIGSPSIWGKEFPIVVCGVPLWSYFCHIYVPYDR